MRKYFYTALQQAVSQQVPATGIGLLRCLYGVIVFQEIIFLLYFNALIFDPVPYLDVAFPLVPFFLCLWGLVALCLVAGLYCQPATIANYCFWVVFVSFTPMRHDFDGGFDQFMTGLGLLLIILPVDRSFALDNLRWQLRFAKFEDSQQPPAQVTILAYYLPVIICLGFLYFDSALHKLYAEHWRNGLGAWLPSTSPYYMSALDLSWLLNQKTIQMLIGYSIFIFQFSFLVAIFYKVGRCVLLFTGIGLHAGITLALNIYPFGLGMLICYVLLVPFSWWRKIANKLVCKTPALTICYQANSLAANRIAIIIRFFDVFLCINIKTRQHQNNNDSQQQSFGLFHSIDRHGGIDTGLKAWIKILVTMRYSAILGWFLLTPGIYHLANKKYSGKAHKHQKFKHQSVLLKEAIESTRPFSCYDRFFQDYAEKQPKRFIGKLAKTLVFIFLLQLNSTMHYAVVYRNKQIFDFGGVFAPLSMVSNSALILSHTFLGITPHALYLHDHFQGYDQILALSYIDDQGQEQWLPFVNQQGRLIAPNWGRVQSMWANVAVTPNIDKHRLAKFIMKVTAFWGTQMGLSLEHAKFIIKRKQISTPFVWEYDLRNKNLQGTWQKIGTANWQDFRFSWHISDKISQK